MSQALGGRASISARLCRCPVQASCCGAAGCCGVTAAARAASQVGVGAVGAVMGAVMGAVGGASDKILVWVSSGHNGGPSSWGLWACGSAILCIFVGIQIVLCVGGRGCYLGCPPPTFFVN